MTLSELKTALAGLTYQHPLTETNVTLVELRGGAIYLESANQSDAERISDLEDRLNEIRGLATT
jgi:hypothetical protein